MGVAGGGTTFYVVRDDYRAWSLVLRQRLRRVRLVASGEGVEYARGVRQCTGCTVGDGRDRKLVCEKRRISRITISSLALPELLRIIGGFEVRTRQEECLNVRKNRKLRSAEERSEC